LRVHFEVKRRLKKGKKRREKKNLHLCIILEKCESKIL